MSYYEGNNTVTWAPIVRVFGNPAKEHGKRRGAMKQVWNKSKYRGNGQLKQEKTFKSLFPKKNENTVKRDTDKDENTPNIFSRFFHWVQRLFTRKK